MRSATMEMPGSLGSNHAAASKCGRCINCKQTGRKKACKLLKCQAAAAAGDASAKLAMLQEDAVGTPLGASHKSNKYIRR